VVVRGVAGSAGTILFQVIEAVDEVGQVVTCLAPNHRSGGGQYAP
jgi:hypothetical protein